MLFPLNNPDIQIDLADPNNPDRMVRHSVVIVGSEAERAAIREYFNRRDRKERLRQVVELAKAGKLKHPSNKG